MCGLNVLPFVKRSQAASSSGRGAPLKTLDTLKDPSKRCQCRWARPFAGPVNVGTVSIGVDVDSWLTGWVLTPCQIRFSTVISTVGFIGQHTTEKKGSTDGSKPEKR